MVRKMILKLGINFLFLVLAYTTVVPLLENMFQLGVTDEAAVSQLRDSDETVIATRVSVMVGSNIDTIAFLAFLIALGFVVYSERETIASLLKGSSDKNSQ